MSKPALTRLLSDEEVAERILPRTSALLDYLDGRLSFEEAFPEDKARDNTLLHRSIAREVYALYFKNLSHVLPPLEGIEKTGFFGDFCRVISSEEYDMVRDERSEDICSENGWVYPYGFSRQSSGQFSLTDTFKRAAQHAKGFIDFVRMDEQTLKHYGFSPIQRAMLTYERASFLCNGIYMADAIVQNLMQVTDFAVSLRHSFEKEVSRQMTRADLKIYVLKSCLF